MIGNLLLPKSDEDEAVPGCVIIVLAAILAALVGLCLTAEGEEEEVDGTSALGLLNLSPETKNNRHPRSASEQKRTEGTAVHRF
jgi:hypothetical protein